MARSVLNKVCSEKISQVIIAPPRQTQAFWWWQRDSDQRRFQNELLRLSWPPGGARLIPFSSGRLGRMVCSTERGLHPNVSNVLDILAEGAPSTATTLHYHLLCVHGSSMMSTATIWKGLSTGLGCKGGLC